MEDRVDEQKIDIKKNLKALRNKLPAKEQDIIDAIVLQLEEAVRISKTLDFGETPANGVRSIIKCAHQWTQYVAEDSRSRKDLENFIPILHLLGVWFEELDHLKNTKHRSLNSPKDPDGLYARVLGIRGHNPKSFEKIHAEGYYARLMPSMKNSLNVLYPGFLSFTASSWKDILDNVFTFGIKRIIKKLSQRLPKFLEFETSQTFLQSFDSIRQRTAVGILRWWFSRGKPPVSEKEYKVTVESVYDIIVDPDNTKLEVRKQVFKKNIKFTVLKDYSIADKEISEKVVIYIHGGAFAGCEYKSFNNMLLKFFCNDIPGMTLVTLDYAFAPNYPFPYGLLDCLECYLWLTSKHTRVKEILGFFPKEVIVCGDSCGGNYAVALSVVLNEIKITNQTVHRPLQPIVLPSSLVLGYPKVSLDDTPYPSTLMMLMDVPLNNFFNNTVFRGYIPMKSRDANNVSNNWKIIKNTDVPLEWPHSSNIDCIRSPFLSPVYYDRLEDLKEIRLMVMGMEFDPLLDDGIHLCRQWKGRADFFCIPELVHAGNTSHFFSSQGKMAYDTQVRMIKEALRPKPNERDTDYLSVQW